MDGTTAAPKEKFADRYGFWGPDQAGLKSKGFFWRLGGLSRDLMATLGERERQSSLNPKDHFAKNLRRPRALLHLGTSVIDPKIPDGQRIPGENPCIPLAFRLLISHTVEWVVRDTPYREPNVLSLHTTLHFLILALATLIGWPQDHLLPVADFASDGRLVDGLLVPDSCTYPNGDHQGLSEIERFLSAPESKFIEDPDDEPTSVSVFRGMLSRGAASCGGAASSLVVSSAPAWSQTATSGSLYLILSRFRC
ncbi:MAG: hypothetical protein JO355_04860 [Planctomycetaceae bacterium]|nr:hypothetical protein [Planctomycetaceae bacterium]